MWIAHQDQIEKVFQKQNTVQEMFEKRRVSLKKLAAKQTRPVQPVAPRPEVKSPLSSPSKTQLRHMPTHIWSQNLFFFFLLSTAFISYVGF